MCIENVERLFLTTEKRTNKTIGLLNGEIDSTDWNFPIVEYI